MLGNQQGFVAPIIGVQTFGNTVIRLKYITSYVFKFKQKHCFAFIYLAGDALFTLFTNYKSVQMFATSEHCCDVNLHTCIFKATEAQE